MEIKKVDISEELRRSYLDYAMDVIVDRALPDARDGLKPVHRRVLYAMHVLHLHFIQNGKKTATVKSARVVGEVMGKYHPHGDAAIYETIVRMAQPFSLRYPLIFGQGNFGSIDGDDAAAMRYTEIKLQKIADELLADLDKETVDLKKNYDSTLDIPDYVLPTKIPNLLVNGSSGIAVGLATNIPTHNLRECIQACLALMDNPDITIRELMRYIPAPDFPTGALIYGRAGIESAYLTGRGRAVIRSRCETETDTSGRSTIVVTEIPYNVNKSEMVRQISDLIAEKKIDGVSGIQDVSKSETGIRIEIELKRGAFPQVVLNKLYKLSSLQSTFSINMVAIVGGRPKTLNLKEALACFLGHRREVVTRRSAFLLAQARDRAHILEALLVALDNMDEIVRIIRSSDDRNTAKQALMGRTWTAGVCGELLIRFGDACRPLSIPQEFGYRDGGYRLTETQADRILDMRLAQLVRIAKDEVTGEYSDLYNAIAEYIEILGSPEKLCQVIRQELEEISERYGDDRRTEIQDAEGEISVEDLISPDDVLLTISRLGYAKYQKLSDFTTYHRGARGKIAARPKNDDYNEFMAVTNTLDDLLLFTNTGRGFRIKVYRFPEATNTSARGRPVVNVLPLLDGESVRFILPVKEFDENCFVVFVTRKGLIKKTRLSQFSKRMAAGKTVLGLREGDELAGAVITTGSDDLMIFTRQGMVLRFNELTELSAQRREELRLRRQAAAAASGEEIFPDEDDAEDTSEAAEAGDEEQGTEEGAAEGETGGDVTRYNVRPSGCTSTGVRGIRLAKGDQVVSVITVTDDGGSVLSISANGKGRRTHPDQFNIARNRGGKGLMLGPDNDEYNIAGAVQVQDDDQIMIITNVGTLVRVNVSEIRVTSRVSQGVKVLTLPPDSYISGVVRVPAAIAGRTAGEDAGGDIAAGETSEDDTPDEGAPESAGSADGAPEDGSAGE